MYNNGTQCRASELYMYDFSMHRYENVLYMITMAVHVMPRVHDTTVVSNYNVPVISNNNVSCVVMFYTKQ